MHAHRGFFMPKNRKAPPMDTPFKILAWFAVISVAADLCVLIPLVIWFVTSFVDDLREERKHRKP